MTQMTLKLKLGLSFGLQLVFLTAIGVIGYFALGEVSHTFNHVIDVSVPKEIILSDLRVAQKDLVIAVTATSGEDNSSDLIAEQMKVLEDINLRFKKATEQFEVFPLDSEEKTQWTEIKENWGPLFAISKKIISTADTTLQSQRLERKQWLKTDFISARKKVRVPVEKLREIQVQDGEKSGKNAANSASQAKTQMVISVIAGMIIGLFAALYLISHLNRLLTRITNNLSDGANQVATAAHQISEASEELSTSVSGQASAIQETSAAIEEISSMIAKTSDNANRSRVISEESQVTVKDGQELIQQMLRAIQDIDQSNTRINSEMENSNREIKEIVKVISEIGVKTQIINDIVFQTKLLSFNASVEAARAGEHGKGFAVVAEEVGNLAQMSGNAAKEISGMLEGGINKVESIVSNSTSRVEGLMKTGKDKVTAGMSIAQKCDEAFRQIVQKTSEVSELVQEISSATQEQSSGVSEVSKAINQLNEATQQSNQVSESSAQAAVSLTGQAQDLAQVVSELMSVVQGSQSRTGFSKPNSDRHAADESENSSQAA